MWVIPLELDLTSSCFEILRGADSSLGGAPDAKKVKCRISECSTVLKYIQNKNSIDIQSDLIVTIKTKD